MKLLIQPQTALVDEKVAIQLTGYAPNQIVTVKAAMSEMPGIQLEAESWAAFQADANGEVNLDQQAPINGTYSGIDAMGLFWSMQPTRVSYNMTRRLDELHFTPRDTTIRLTAEVDGATVAEAKLLRQYVAPNVVIEDVKVDGLIGKYFYPAHSDTAPGSTPSAAIIVLGGGEGGLGAQLQWAALFASHGYPSLALAYYRFEQLPEQLHEIPLEYFERAIRWLHVRPEVAPTRIGLFGRSKGAELSLLLGAVYPQLVQAVAASSPSSTVCIGGLEKKAGDHFQTYSSWSYQGLPLPYVDWTQELCAEGSRRLANGERIDSIHLAAFEQCDIVEEACIKVERIQGPVLILTSSDDHWWPSGLYGEQITDRLSRNHFPYRFEHLHYEGAGHNIRFPYIPTTQLGMNGGTAALNAFASSDSWGRVLALWRELDQLNG